MSLFLNCEGIKGESADKNHKDWVDIESMRWGSQRYVTSQTSTQGDRESSNAIVTDLKITKLMDSATPNIFINSCCSRGCTMVIHLTKTGAGGGADVYMEYTLHNAIFTEYSVAANSRDNQRPYEHITISFVDLEVKYIPYDEDGNAMAPIAVGFDTATNTKK